MTYTDEFKAPDKGRTYMAIRGGRAFDLENPKPEDFQPLEIAQSLAHEHRYSGNYGPYSVAQHAVLVCEVVERYLSKACWRAQPGTLDPMCLACRYTRLAALHHDDTEGVIGDLCQPAKALCPDFKRLEKRLETALCLRYGINVDEPIIKEADRIVFCAEVRCLVPAAAQHLYGAYGDPNYRLDLQPDWEDLIFWSPDEATKRYMQLHTELSQ